MRNIVTANNVSLKLWNDKGKEFTGEFSHNHQLIEVFTDQSEGTGKDAFHRIV